jgi:UDP-N-acetylmuramoyl-L-alanyl-D-glutamate--2,6-diaminopimelate ligase
VPVVFRDVLRQVDFRHLKGDLATPITGVAYDSRQVCAGGVFVALSQPRHPVDGHDYLAAALANGAAALVIQEGKEALLPPGTPIAISVPNPHLALAQIATAFYSDPSAHMTLVGITGTNGKSTTAHLVNLLHKAAGHTAGLIGTIAYELAGEIYPAPNTTPLAPELQALFAKMRDRHITHVAMEVSSHALDQHRADGCRFRIAVFTNLTRDHLDYHGDPAAYLAAKARLFSDASLLPADGERLNIINGDDPAGMELARMALGKTYTYGIATEADIRARYLQLSARHTQLVLETPMGTQELQLGLLGRFNVYNALAAAGAALGEGIPLDQVVAVLREAQPPAGRFQRLASEACTVIVDYAHTPDGLEKVLATAKGFCTGRLIVVFGCGGDRDSGKRPIMGELATRYGDLALVTSDNPRTEDPQTIINHILAGIPEARCGKYRIEPDREKAIHFAIAQANPDDIVLLAGKGHEDYQIIGHEKIHFDDREVALEALKKKH